MRILFVSNLLPPYARGGYEQWCEEVAAALAARGHTLAVLTAEPPRQPPVRHAAGGDAVGDPAGDAARPFRVYRLLRPQVEGGLRDTVVRLLRNPQRVAAANALHVRRVLDEFRPEVVLVWGMWNIDRSVPQLLEACMGSALAYYFCDYWPSLPNAYIQRLQEPARRAEMEQLKGILRRQFLPGLTAADDIPLRLEHPICVSKAVRDILVTRGVRVEHAQIIYGGTTTDEFDEIEEIDEFTGSPRAAYSGAPAQGALRLLYIGRLERIKGVHTVVSAMRSVPAEVSLDIAGGGEAPYAAELREMIAAGGLEGRVRLLGPVPRAQIPALFRGYDALVFPSEWEEPFARSVLEAMAAGLPVIGTTTGGTGEILREGVTGLAYPAGDAQALAAQIRVLAGDPPLRRQLGAAGSRTVRQYYTIGRMVDELEAALTALAQQPAITSC